jgi:hypothetical protein
MPDLSESLQGRDLGHLHILAEFWGIELDAPDVRSALPQLVNGMLSPTLAFEVTRDLSGEALAALQELKDHAGRLPWAQFTRRYGELREMGAGRRDRELPYLDPISVAELLWYHGLIARAFFDTPEDVDEFAYLPDDLLVRLFPPGEETSQPMPILPPADANQPSSLGPLGRAALPVERTQVFPANESILDHACTLLAALRSGIPAPLEFPISTLALPLTATALQGLLTSCQLLDEASQPLPEATRLFLEAPRGQALASLARGWLESKSINEVRMIPGLSPEGSWQNDPLQARQAMLRFLHTLPEARWWQLVSFIAAVKEQQPDFQRRGGEYDTWFIRRIDTGEFLRGFEHWEDVEGALLTYYINGPLAWLGMVDLAAAQPDGPVTAFRASAWGQTLLAGETPRGLPSEEARLIVRSDACIHAPRLTPRTVRYQLSRFCQREKETPDGYDYRLTPASLARASQQGLAVQHLLSLLRKSAEALPPSLVKALERWEAHGSQARIESLSVLRFHSPEILTVLRSSRAARFLGEPLGPAAIAVKAGAEQKVLAVLAELGYLGESRIES